MDLNSQRAVLDVVHAVPLAKPTRGLERRSMTSTAGAESALPTSTLTVKLTASTVDGQPLTVDHQRWRASDAMSENARCDGDEHASSCRRPRDRLPGIGYPVSTRLESLETNLLYTVWRISFVRIAQATCWWRMKFSR